MNIALIGIMGCGKSTVGKSLQNIMSDFVFVDTDELIVQKENTSINDIFENNGEDYFRNLETLILKDVLSLDNQIISTGGGIVINPDNLLLLKQFSKVIYLKTSVNTLCERLKNDSQRPLLKNQNLQEKLNILLSQREDKYNQAHIIIETDNKTPDMIVKEIINCL